jgi:hypothetical protein
LVCLELGRSSRRQVERVLDTLKQEGQPMDFAVDRPGFWRPRAPRQGRKTGKGGREGCCAPRKGGRDGTSVDATSARLNTGVVRVRVDPVALRQAGAHDGAGRRPRQRR